VWFETSLYCTIFQQASRDVQFVNGLMGLGPVLRDYAIMLNVVTVLSRDVNYLHVLFEKFPSTTVITLVVSKPGVL
jgi:hypothetical protein